MSEEIYRQRILDHYKNPRNFGKLKKSTHKCTHENISCGDELCFEVNVVKNKIKDIGFTGTGCAISIASASIISEYLYDKSFSAIQKLTFKEVQKMLGIRVSSARELCAMLCVETLKNLEKK